MVTPTHPPIIWSTTSQSKIHSVNFYFKSTDPKNRAIQQHSDPVTSNFLIQFAMTNRNRFNYLEHQLVGSLWVERPKRGQLFREKPVLYTPTEAYNQLFQLFCWFKPFFCRREMRKWDKLIESKMENLHFVHCARLILSISASSVSSLLSHLKIYTRDNWTVGFLQNLYGKKNFFFVFFTKKAKKTDNSAHNWKRREWRLSRKMWGV